MSMELTQQTVSSNRRKTRRNRLGAVTIVSAAAAGACYASSGQNVLDSSSAYVPGSASSSSLKASPPTARAPAVDAWMIAARRGGEGKADANAYLEAAWHSTQTWWLRPLAYAVAVGLAGQARFKIFFFPEEATARIVDDPSTVKRMKESDRSTIMQCLQSLESPFFATSATWEGEEGFGIKGFRIKGNLRRNNLQVEDIEKVRCQLAQELESRHIDVHIVRSKSWEAGDIELWQARRDGIEADFEMLVRDEFIVTTSGAATSSIIPVALGAATVAATSSLGSSTMFEKVGAAVAPGSHAPLGMLLGLVLIGEAARWLAARQTGVILDSLPALLPSPQLGIIGSVRGNREPFPNRTAALAVSLAAPVAMGICSLLLVIGSLNGMQSGAVDLSQANVRAAWTLGLLPDHCDAAMYAGAQGLFMAGLALLPQSPDGKVAWTMLHGKGKADRLAEAAGYIWPLLGLASVSIAGPSWSMLAFWWTFILINIERPVDRERPPVEEVSPIPPQLRLAGHWIVGVAVLVAIPFPLHEIAKFYSEAPAI